jgi:hypothetical protein
MTQNTPSGYVRAILPRRIVIVLHQMIWLPQSIEMIWTAGRRKMSQQVLSICGNSFKTVGQAFLMVERMPRVCKAVIKAKGGYFGESKIYLDLFNTFLVTT